MRQRTIGLSILILLGYSGVSAQLSSQLSYIKFKAATASLYAIQLAHWVESVGTKERNNQEKQLRDLADLLGFSPVDDIAKTKTYQQAIDAYIVSASVDDYRFRLQGSDYVVYAYRLGSYVGQIKLNARGLYRQKGRTAQILTSLGRNCDNLFKTAEALGDFDAIERAELQIILDDIRQSKNPQKINKTADHLVLWHLVYTAATSSFVFIKDQPELMGKLRFSAEHANLNAFEVGCDLTVWTKKVAAKKDASNEIKMIGEEIKFFGVPFPGDLQTSNYSHALEAETAYRMRLVGLLSNRQYGFLVLGGYLGNLRNTCEKISGFLSLPLRNKNPEGIASIVLSDIKVLREQAIKNGLPQNLLDDLTKLEESVKEAKDLNQLYESAEAKSFGWYMSVCNYLLEKARINSN